MFDTKPFSDPFQLDKCSPHKRRLTPADAEHATWSVSVKCGRDACPHAIHVFVNTQHQIEHLMRDNDWTPTYQNHPTLNGESSGWICPRCAESLRNYQRDLQQRTPFPRTHRFPNTDTGS